MVSFVFGWGLPSPIIESHQNKKWMWPWARGALQNFGVSFNISATGEASEFKFGTQLDLLRPIIKLNPEEKMGAALGKGSSPKFWGSPLINCHKCPLNCDNSP